MLKLTKTGIGLLTRQYRSVLKKCLLINLGIFAATVVLLSESYGYAVYGSTTSNGVAIGSESYYANATGSYATAIGSGARADAHGAVSIGPWATSNGSNSVALGDSPSATGAYSIAIGYHAIGDGYNSVAIGKQSVAYEDNVVSFGYKAGDVIVGDKDEGEYTATGNLYRRLINVEAGVNDHDVVIMGQIKNFVTSSTLSSYATQDWVNNKGYLTSVATGNIANGAVTDAKIASGITASKIVQDASHRFVSDTERATWNGYSTTIAGKADSATTLSGYGITDAYTKTEVEDLISGSGSSYSAGTGISLANKVISLDSNYLDNNYYRKNKKSGILGGVKAGEIGNEIGDNLSQLVANDNFHLVNDGIFSNQSTTFDAKVAENVPAAELRFNIANETGKEFAKMPFCAPTVAGTSIFFCRKNIEVLDNFSQNIWFNKTGFKVVANDNFATTTFLRAI